MTPLELTIPVGYVMCAFWFFYFACMGMVHHRRIRIRASLILTIFGFCEVGCCIIKAISQFIEHFFIIVQVMAVNLLLAGMILFDVLYKDFFHDEGPYTLCFGKKTTPLIAGWGLSNLIAFLHDSGIFLSMGFLLIGCYSIGPIIIVYLVVKIGRQLKSLEKYVHGEYEYAKDDVERRKMTLVSKQYNFISRNFLVLVFVPLFDIFGFLARVLFGENIITFLFNVLIVIFLIVGNSFQILGFFYPVPRIKEILMGEAESSSN